MLRIAFLPSPTRSVISLGPFTIHFYALAIILGVAVAIYMGNKRFVAMGGSPGVVSDVALFAVPAGVIGGRIYHVLTTPELYFGKNGHLEEIFFIWKGGLGIWGAISLGYLGAYIGWRRIIKEKSSTESSLTFLQLVDALAPGIVLAQAIGRWGNWFNRELFGRPTDLPWGLKIPLIDRPSGFLNFETFHPTFLYESLWCVGVAIVLLSMRPLNIKPGTIFIAYISLYTLGRIWIEALRIDDAHHILGMRFNVWIALVFFLWSSSLLISRLRNKTR